MSVAQISGILIVIGSLAFMAAAAPIGGEVYAQTDPKRQMEIISGKRRGWIVSQMLFAVSSLVVVSGIWLYTKSVEAPRAQFLLIISAVMFAIGAFIWTIHVCWRALKPQYVLFRYGTFSLAFATFVAFGVFTSCGLALLGVAILQLGTSKWLGTLILALTVPLAAQLVVFRGSYIPLLFYFPTLISGIVLIM